MRALSGLALLVLAWALSFLSSPARATVVRWTRPWRWLPALAGTALAFAFMARSPEHFRVLLDDPMGPTLIVAAILLQVIGTLIIRKLVNIEY